MISKHANARMKERNISVATTLACVHCGEKSLGYWDATRHHLFGFTAVTQQAGNGLKVVTVYEDHSR